MGKNVKVAYKELQKLQKRIGFMQDSLKEDFFKVCAKELAARLLRKLDKRTPVGDYKESGKVGGTLRRGWTTESEQTAMYTALFGGGEGSGKYINSLSVSREGSDYVIEVINPVKYASYVEYGHRTRGGNGWVPGKFMMTISKKEIERIAPALLQKRLETKLREAFK